MMAEDLATVFPAIEILRHEPLAHYTHTKTGGPADYLAFPTNIQETKSLLAYANQEQLPVTVIGNASNLIVKDGGIRGLVMILTKMDQITADATHHTVTAAAGAALIKATQVAQANALSGFEWAAGIPGSVGGAVFMNAGAYGGEISNVATSVEVLTPQGEIRTLSLAEMDFGYRHSSVQDYHDIVLAATFTLTPGEKPAIQAQMDELNARRAAKQPLELPSCGSVFKRPTGHYTGQLIQEAGLQGLKWGGAQVSTKHAGFIVNIDHATATDYLDLIHHIQAVIWEKNQVHLETEVRIIGEDPQA
ncbi:UDP-N-acetylmuramate dehydrogenase [Lactobacillus sp. PFC-70]|uniref:UDP-N-acetylenolpyruvoylglucosamine reductase n=1 Tax=Levilactobacillus namurensis TaxID=380393 RepID=A0AAW8W727_9LACO|nr:UDP-N-acetylmuramate dehydrogenase [Levilactobacillus namurensis]PTM21901.1 UDP-N-acetylmuramate dehydrogenase [Lactobacillus sp. PFC-70]MCW3778184.1 UDP-N-acetylmuramate dehydrogenase [Levilactobacillus namurensis]MDT7014997.1 UDP-N-acetylmuramate dehydrogenase [Levilactobacillus namurensis]MDT7018058.1 UDP-N-acetylmuramate dehydrogenase [Levilactobacillus namurensis]WNN64950.1 UDP-N-acetylmuramate dehydrogenase [Levilactobacillus namurensis]